MPFCLVLRRNSANTLLWILRQGQFVVAALVSTDELDSPAAGDIDKSPGDRHTLTDWVSGVTFLPSQPEREVPFEMNPQDSPPPTSTIRRS